MKKDSYKMKIAMCVLLFISCSLWFFNGIMGCKKIAFFVAFCGFLVLCTTKFRVSKLSAIWLLFLFAILMSLLINNAVTRWVLFFYFMYILPILYAILIKTDVSDFKTGIILLSGIGIINALMVLIHFFLKDKFNEFYFPFLKYDGALETANSYYERGYYFGFNYKPHETAGIIVFAMAAFLLWGITQKEYRKKIIYMADVCLLVPLLLTGKKGVIGCMFVVLMFMLLVWYASKKQWIKIIGSICISIVLLIIAAYYIWTHPDNPLFYRFSAFLTNLTSGRAIGAGRGSLRDAAWQLWKENKLFGVGWFQFNGYTVSKFGFSRSHSVNLDYLQFLCETGIVGFGLMITPIIIMIYRTFKVWIETLKFSNSTQTQWIILFAVFVQGYTVLYAFVEVPFYNIMYFTIYMFSSMIINNACHRTMKGQADTHS